MNKQGTIIAILAAVLLAVVAASAVLLWLLPGDEVRPGSSIPSANRPAPTPLSSSTTPATATFKLQVLETRGYRTLDTAPVTEGAVPVLPHATPGKANPFL